MSARPGALEDILLGKGYIRGRGTHVKNTETEDFIGNHNHGLHVLYGCAHFARSDSHL
jgi:hypothetical protein